MKLATYLVLLDVVGSGCGALCCGVAGTVKVTVRLAGSCRRVEGGDGHLEQSVGFAGILFRIRNTTQRRQ